MRRIGLTILILVMALLGACSKADPQSVAKEQGDQVKSDFPNKPIELIVPFNPGGGTDLLARSLANAVSKYLPNGQSVVVVNKPGGAGVIGVSEVFKAKPDGYKIGITVSGTVNIQPHYGKTVYTHDSFQTIIGVQSTPQLLIVKADAPWKTYEEWLEYVKQNPGKFTYGIAGAGNIQQIGMESVNEALGIKTKPVAFDGAAPSMNALLGGHVDGAVVQSIDAKTHLESGAVRALVNIGSTNNEDYLKDIPFVKEKGANVEIDGLTFLIAPKGMPTDVLQILHDAFKKSLDDPKVNEQYKKLGMLPVYTGSEDLQQKLSDDFVNNKAVLDRLGLLK